MAHSRNKGRRGESTVANILRDRDWIVDNTRCGIITEDMIATDTHGNEWSVEVKNTKSITMDHLEQARRQAKKRKMPWMLINKIPQTKCWLVRRKGMDPEIWKEKC